MIVDVIDLELEVLNFPRSYTTDRKERAKKIHYHKGVEIQKVEKINENKYEITAEVEGNYGNYEVELDIENTMIKDYSCTCADYRNGYICKHIIATSLEVIDPNGPSTKEGKRKVLEQRKREIEEARR